MNALTLLLGIKPCSGNATTLTQNTSAGNSGGNALFGEALVLALEASQQEAGTEDFSQQTDTEGQTPVVELDMQIAANPAAGFPLVNLLVQAVPSEPAAAASDILETGQTLPIQNNAQLATNQPQIITPTHPEAITQHTEADSVLLQTAHANPATIQISETVQQTPATPVQASGEQNAAKPTVQALAEQPLAESPQPIDTKIDTNTNHATNRQAASVNPEQAPAPQQETPPAGSGIRADEAAQSARISTDEPVTTPQAPVVTAFEGVAEGSQLETGQGFTATVETPEVAPQPRIQAETPDVLAPAEDNQVELTQVVRPEQAPAEEARGPVNDTTTATTAQSQDTTRQGELAETPPAASEAIRVNRPREPAEPLPASRADDEAQESQSSVGEGISGLIEEQYSSVAGSGSEFARRSPFQNPEAASLPSERAKAVEENVFTTGEELTPEPVTTARQEVSPAVASVMSGAVSEARNAALGTETASLHAPDQARMVDQVVKAIDLSQRQGTTDLTVRLDPPELGTLHIKVSMTAGQLSAEVRAADSRIHQMIAVNQAEIHEALRQAGVRLEQITVPSYTSASGGFSHPEQHANWANTGARPGFSTNHFQSESRIQDDQPQLRYASGIRSGLLDTLA